MPHPRVLLHDGCMVWLLVWRYVFLCVYITLAGWLLVLVQKVGGGTKTCF